VKKNLTYGLKMMVASLLMLGCDAQLDWDLHYQEEDILVVEGKISSELRRHEVRLTRPFYEMNGSPEPVSGAVLDIYDGRLNYTLSEDPERPGVYRTDSLFAAEPDRYYQLRIRHEDRRITAVSFMRKVEAFQDMNVFPVQSDPPLLEAHISDSDEPSIVRLELDWSQVPGYEGLPDSATHAVVYHYSLNSVDVNEIFRPEQEHVRFPPGTMVYREKESVNPWYAEYLRGMLSETNWRGGMFDVLPGNARTNMEGDAVGFFTAADIIRDTIRRIGIQQDQSLINSNAGYPLTPSSL
jgi:hypothetical protein